MTNPQKEKGSTDISNKVLEAIILFPFTVSELKVIFFVLRSTWGWHKPIHRMSNTFISEGTGLEIRFTKKVIKDLVSKQTLVIAKKQGQNWISFNKHYDKWVVSKQTLDNPKNEVQDSIIPDNNEKDLVSKQTLPLVSKQTLKKLNIKKLNNTDGEKILKKFEQVFGHCGIKSTAGFEKNMLFWMGSYTLEDIFRAIELSKNHEFWKDKITPIILFRTRNKAGSCDVIGDLLNGDVALTKTCGQDERGCWVEDEDGKIYMSKESMEEEMKRC